MDTRLSGGVGCGDGGGGRVMMLGDCGNGRCGWRRLWFQIRVEVEHSLEVERILVLLAEHLRRLQGVAGHLYMYIYLSNCPPLETLKEFRVFVTFRVPDFKVEF